MSHFRFTVVSHSSFHTPGISIRSMCIGACHACTASLCDLGDPGWGDPGFRHRVFFAWHPKVHPVMLMVFLFVFTMDDLLRTGHRLPCHYVSSSLRWFIPRLVAVFLFVVVVGCASFLVFVSLRFLGGMKSYCSAPRIQGACHSIGFTCSN